MFSFNKLLSFMIGSVVDLDARRTPPLWVVWFRSGEYIVVEAGSAADARDGNEVQKRLVYDANRFAVTRVEPHRFAVSWYDTHTEVQKRPTPGA